MLDTIFEMLDTILVAVMIFLYVFGLITSTLIAVVFSGSWLLCRTFKRKSNKKVEVIICIVLGIILTLTVTLWSSILFESGPNHPLDEDLIRNFDKHKDQFQQLAGKIEEDKGIRRIDDDWTDPDDLKTIGISNEDLKEYRNVFNRLRIPRGFCNYDEHGIKFIVSTYGMAFTNSSLKGYFYSEIPPDKSKYLGPLVDSTNQFHLDYPPSDSSLPEPLVGSNDQYWASDGRWFRCCREISDNWYVFFEYHK